MTATGRALWWGSAPAALLRLDLDGYVLDANDTFLAWCGGPGHDPLDPREVLGRRLSDLLTAGGRIYWDTHVAPMLVLRGQVDDVAAQLRSRSGPLPVLLSARRTGGEGDGHDDANDGIDAVLLSAHHRDRFERELVAARASAERSAQRLRWVQDATAALSQAAGVDSVVAALLTSVTRHVSVATAELSPAAAEAAPEGRLHVPVGAGPAGHGTLVVVPHGRPGDAPVDPDALATIARHGALALDRARLHEQSVSVARELQHAMLTQDLPRRDDLAVAAEYRPATRGLEVGGDWYDAFMVDPTTVALCVGDVVGHGLPAATTMGQLRTATRALAAPGLGPGAVLRLVDRFVGRHHAGFGATLVHAELDTRDGLLRYACAGHPPPLLVRADGTARYLWDGRSVPLGVPGPHAGRAAGAVRLDRGDAVLLYTDGVAERRDRPLHDGLDRLLAVAAAHAGDPDLPALVVETLGNARDDACVLQLTWYGRPPRGGAGPRPGGRGRRGCGRDVT
ncbi:hypothetical protein GCM10009809_34000 [Isoptericola hypogeus]|uniref:PPM-type phosphatase domain-containing protein n=1 Tax=Isoptericola hypogeus TaxID=300179 RepID=A0ABP4VS91_9MICO